MTQSKVSVRDAIGECLRYLAGKCDGAIEDDGVGFNGFDSRLGHDLAGLDRPLSDRQLVAAAVMLQKYRKQLSGFTLPSVEEVRRFVVSDDSEITLYTPTDRVIAKPIKRGAVAIVPVVDEKPWLTSEWRSGLNEQQAQAFDLAHEWFFSPDGVNEPFVLAGRPGSGKSHTAQRIAKSIAATYEARNGRRLKIALTAPTHRARAILENFAASIGLACHVSTMHSLLHLIPGKADHNGKTKLEVNTWSQEPHWNEFGLVIADEQSMTGKELFKFVASSVPTILMGDHRQLFPVEDETNMVGELSPVFSLPCGIELTKVVRYDGAIAFYVDAIADAIDEGSQFLPQIAKFETDTGNLIRLGGREIWEREMIETFKTIDIQQNPTGARALAWTNKRVDELNSKIRFALTGVSPDVVRFMKGDRVMANEPIIRKVMTDYGEKSETLMKTCDEGVVESVIPDFIHINSEVIHVNWVGVQLDEGFGVNVMTIDLKSMSIVAEMVATEKRKALTSEDKAEKKKHWRMYFELLEQFSLVAKGKLMQRLQYSFASTVHKSQGGTYDYVFSDHQNMMQCRDVATRSRLIYVASSRASQQLIAYAKY
jgi:exodeoxyribonuclease-5